MKYRLYLHRILCLMTLLVLSACGGQTDDSAQDIKVTYNNSLNQGAGQNPGNTDSTADTALWDSADLINGKNKYQQLCSACHGPTGQKKNGVISEKLDYSLTLLTQYVDLTMPDQMPHLCVGDCARDTAAYILNGYTTSRGNENPGQNNGGSDNPEDPEHEEDLTNANPALLSGRALYEEQCSSCHGDAGVDQTGLFTDIDDWAASMNIAQLYTVIRDSMPKGDPAACGTSCSAAVTAYIAAGFTVFGDVPEGIPNESDRHNGGSYSQGLTALSDAIANRVFSQRAATHLGTSGTLKIEAEHFDTGGAGVSYFEVDSIKNGDLNQRPNDGVDIQGTSDAGSGFNIGWTNANEWLEYSFYNEASQSISLTLRIATIRTVATTMTWFIDGQQQGAINLPLTGGFQAYQNASGDSVLLAPGWHSIRVRFDSNNVNFNYLTIARAATQPPAAERFDAKPGTTPLHRLTNMEYRRTVKSLFAVDVPSSALLADSVLDGFDRMASILTVDSQVRFENYLTQAEAILTDVFDDTVLRSRIMSCELSAGTLSVCGKSIVTTWADKALRRKPSDDDITRHLNYISSQISTGIDADDSIKNWLIALLVSPEFLHHVEFDPEPETDYIHRISGRELANRLSYFIWCSSPDDELITLGNSGALFNVSTFNSQIDRMINDAKSSCMSESFAFQWFGLGRFNQNSLVLNNTALADAMLEETKVFFQKLLQNNAPISELLGSTQSYMNSALAAYYGLPAPDGQGLVSLTGSNRRGLLTQGSVLISTASLNNSTFIKRGVFALDNLLCDAPPPPPANIDQSLNTDTNNTCQQCHRYINPIGVALNKFNNAGAFTQLDANNRPIDTRGQFYQGASFEGAIEMINVLKSDERLSECATEKFFTYAHARAPETVDDHDMLVQMRNTWLSKGAGLKDLIKIIVASPSFQYRYAEQSVE